MSNTKVSPSKRRLITYLLCLLAAVVVWIAVMATDPPQTAVRYTDIPVSVYLDDTAALFEYDIASHTETVDARLSATRIRHIAGRDSLYALATVRAGECREGEITVSVVFKDENGNVFLSDKPVNVTVTLVKRSEQ